MKRSIDILEPPKAPTHKWDMNHVALAYARVYDCVKFLSGASDNCVLKRWCLPIASLTEWNFLSELWQGSCIRNADEQCSWPPPDEASLLPTPTPLPPLPNYLAFLIGKFRAWSFKERNGKQTKQWSLLSSKAPKCILSHAKRVPLFNTVQTWLAWCHTTT